MNHKITNTHVSYQTQFISESIRGPLQSRTSIKQDTDKSEHFFNPGLTPYAPDKVGHLKFLKFDTIHTRQSGTL